MIPLYRWVAVPLLATVASASPARQAIAERRQTQRTAPFVKAFGPERSYKRGDHPSPDGKWVLRVSHPDTHLIVELRRAGEKAVRLRAESVSGFIWAPKHPHRLLVSTGAVYGKAMLVMWEGGREWTHLVRAKRPNDEYFVLLGVAPDGRAIVYRHASDIDDPSGTFQQELKKRWRLTLPTTPSPRRPRQN